MSDITLGQIEAFIVWIGGFIGATSVIVVAVKKAIEKGFKPVNDKIERVDRNSTMNYLVDKMTEIDKGEKLDGVSRKRFIDQYEHYTKDLEGNTYIKEEYDRLKKEGKL